MNLAKIFTLSTSMFALIFSIQFSFADVNIMAVSKTPLSENTKIEILNPQNLEVENGSSIQMKVRVSNYPLGEDSNFPRAKEVYNWDIGQSIRISVDNKPFFAKITPQISSSNDKDIYFQKTYQFELPFFITEGKHIIRAYLVRSYGESLKSKNTFDVVSFYYKHKKELHEDIDLSKPYLTVNEPADDQIYDDDKPILLDFYLKNCNLSQNGYKVKIIIDDALMTFLEKWTPYYILGLRKGNHTINLQLVDANKEAVPGLFNDITTKFSIK